MVNGNNGNNGKRHLLEGSIGKRVLVCGIYQKKRSHRYGTNVKTRLLFKQVRWADSGKLATEHLWVNETQGFMEEDLRYGDIVQFEGRVYQYSRENGTKDYSLKNPSKIEKLGREEPPRPPHHRRRAEGPNPMLTMVLTGNGRHNPGRPAGRPV